MDYPFVDIHTHARTGEGIEVVSVMAGTQAAGDTAIASGASPKQSGDWPEPPFSIGVHPWQAGEVDLDAALRELETAPAIGRNADGGLTETSLRTECERREATRVAPVAIGEIGLDYAVPGDHDRQKRVFAACLRIARERRLPVVLHCVRAFEPVMEMLAGHTLPAVIFHGFVGSREQAVRAVRAGYYLSFGERSLNSPKTVEALKTVPLENLFLETDESNLPIAEIYTRAAGILAIPVANLKEQLYKNYLDYARCLHRPMADSRRSVSDYL